MTTQTKLTGSPANRAIGYRYNVKGRYWAAGESGKTKKFYDAEFLIPEIVKYKSGLVAVDRVAPNGDIKKKYEPNIIQAHILKVEMHYIQRYLLEAKLQDDKRYPDFIRVQTCEITNKKRVYINSEKYRDVTKLTFDQMTASDLFQFHLLNDLNTDLKSYGSLGDRKIAVAQEWRDVLASRNMKPKTHEDSMVQPPEGADMAVEDEEMEYADGEDDPENADDLM